MSSASASSSLQKLPLDPAQRVLHVLLGGVALLGCAALALLLGWISLTAPLPAAPPWGRAVLGGCALLFALGARWGGHLVARGARGFRLVSERALRRNRALVDPSSPQGLAFLTLTAVSAFLLLGGRPGALGDPWELTALGYVFTCGLWLVPAVTLHEFGHAAAASALGLGWSTLRIGPLELHRAEGRTHVRWHAEGLVSLLGFVRTESRALHEAPSRLAWVALAGPAASLLGAGVHAALAHALGDTGPRDAHGLAALLWGGAFLHAALGLFNLMPLRLATGQLSDGALWLALRRLAAQPEDARLLGTLQVESSTRRPRDWSLPVDPVLTAASAPGASAETGGWLHLYALCMLLDRADFPAARALLTRLAPTLDTLPAPCPQELRLQGALLYALGEAPDAARARAFLKAAGPHATHPLYPRLAEAAVLLGEGQPEAARAALLAWEADGHAQGLTAQWRIGNQWALERLRAALGVAEEDEEEPETALGAG
ncbi:M50 family metallopeptidase [Archangium primigenium]|uniref:M50 family metallopeptidase n=1 Tax=[Archangium] primigenium TaxID=2792470 RepID=UPI00195EA2A2|nr:M50 family metallopeptidase [Archangium primigenium]MBM7112550.1 M50 family metallopeptidase [Archangium primigenium]